MQEIRNRRIKLKNIDGLGDFNKDLSGVVISQSDRDHCVIQLDEEIFFNNKKAIKFNISARHQGKHLDDIVPKGFRKYFNIQSIVAVSVVDDSNLLSFVAEIILGE